MQMVHICQSKNRNLRPQYYLDTRGGEQSSTRYHPILAARQPSQPLTRPLSVTWPHVLSYISERQLRAQYAYILRHRFPPASDSLCSAGHIFFPSPSFRDDIHLIEDYYTQIYTACQQLREIFSGSRWNCKHFTISVLLYFFALFPA